MFHTPTPWQGEPWDDDPLQHLYEPDGYDTTQPGHHRHSAYFSVDGKELTRLPKSIWNDNRKPWRTDGKDSIDVINVLYNIHHREVLHLVMVKGHRLDLTPRGYRDRVKAQTGLNLAMADLFACHMENESNPDSDIQARQDWMAWNKAHSFDVSAGQIIKVAKLLKIKAAANLPDSYC